MEILSEAGGRRGRKPSFRPYMAQSRKQTRFFFLFFFFFSSSLHASLHPWILGFRLHVDLVQPRLRGGSECVLEHSHCPADSLNRTDLCCCRDSSHSFIYCWRSGPANKRLGWGRSQSTEPKNVQCGVWAVEEKRKTIGSMNCMRSCKVQKIFNCCTLQLSVDGLDGWKLTHSARYADCALRVGPHFLARPTGRPAASG